jgi:hypothetical protein
MPRSDNRAHLVAVFENIHWLRYSDSYRASFLSDVEQVALGFPDITFLLKPHPAGKWLTKRYQGRLPQAENLIIADPDDPKCARYTSADWIKLADGVITTPSTVALDAVRLGFPVGVIAYDFPPEEYRPLTLIRSTNHWNLKQNGSKFLDAVVVPGDAVGRIITRNSGYSRPLDPDPGNTFLWR